MINNKLILLIILYFSFNLLLAEKSSLEIQQDIDKRNSELNSLKNEIKTVETQIQKKIL